MPSSFLDLKIDYSVLLGWERTDFLGTGEGAGQRCFLA